MRSTIPSQVIAVVADVLGKHYYNHNNLNTLFAEHGAPGDPPLGNCVTKCTEWLRRCNTDLSVDPFAVLGGVLQELMDEEPNDLLGNPDPRGKQERIRKVLANHGLSYHLGGQIIGATTGTSTRSLTSILKDRDFKGVEIELQRNLATVELDPPAAITAACSLIESLCKIYIEDKNLQAPSKETIKDLWKVVSKHLGLDAGHEVDQDVNRILSGAISIIDGVGALRTHGGSAHGRGRGEREIDPRYARLAIHAAHTIATFIIETWEAKKA